ncbi:MAG: transketolase [Mycoplasma sp.]|nr:transketolase [Mycoplasma sp.]
MENRDLISINTLKMNGVAAVNKANSGHPGIVLSAAPMVHTLFTRHIIFDPNNTKFINRDRFVLSAGHGSALLYSLYRILGMISEKDLKDFRQLGSITPGHPEFGMTKGVETTTGPLGQGLATAVGMALAESHLNSKFNEIDHHTYVIVGDGDLQEGVANEAISLAGRMNLNKLIVLHDSNDIQLDTATDKVTNENLKLKFKSMNWNYILVKQNTPNAIDKAIKKAKTSVKPTFIEIKTIIGEGTTNQGTSSVHGAPLGDDIKTLIDNLNWEGGEFNLPNEVVEFYKETLVKRSQEKISEFKESKELTEFLKEVKYEIKVNISKDIATRASGGEVLKHLNENVPNILAGSADLSGSTKVLGADGVFSPENRQGRNILFGVREFAMGAIANGLALHSNIKPVVSTFFVFSDYVKPAIRLSALMHLPVTYVFTHDSVYVGEDGPTHEPIEQLAMLRSIPNVVVFRPGDEKEVIGAWQFAITSKKHPTIIVLTRQNITSLKNTSEAKVKNGMYQLRTSSNKSKWNIVATGSEIANAYKLGEEFDANVYSIPSVNLVKSNKLKWENTISIEAGTTFGWGKFAKHNFGIDTFGHSGNGDQVYKEVGLDYVTLKKQISKIVGK